MRHLLVAMLLAAAPMAGQSVPPGTGFAVSKDAKLQLDSMARRTLVDHTEQLVCVTSSHMIDSTYIVAKVAPARHIVVVDSLQVVPDGPVCEPWQPTIHSHLIDNGWLNYPSPSDQHFAASRGVFGFLMSVHPDTSFVLRAYP
jgi:hypothetical protein